MQPTLLTVAAVCVLDPQDALLVVRKKRTTAFMLPGGKLEDLEAPIDAACREAFEETGCVLDVAVLNRLGLYECAAAHEADTRIIAHVFTYREPLPTRPTANAEIAELQWLARSQRPLPSLAPLLITHVLPAIWGEDQTL